MSPQIHKGHHPPRQRRSRASYEALLESAARLLESKSFEATTTDQICRAAGLTVGAFYARFGSKEALLLHLHERVVRHWDELEREWGEEIQRTDAGLAARVHGLVSRLVCAYREHKGVMRAVVQRARNDPAIAARLIELRERTVTAAAERLLEVRAEIVHPDPELSVAFGLHLVRSALRERVLFDEEWAGSGQIDDTLLVQELCRAFLAYVGLPTES